MIFLSRRRSRSRPRCLKSLMFQKKRLSDIRRIGDLWQENEQESLKLGLKIIASVSWEESFMHWEKTWILPMWRWNAIQRENGRSMKSWRRPSFAELKTRLSHDWSLGRKQQLENDKVFFKNPCWCSTKLETTRKTMDRKKKLIIQSNF